MLRGKQPIIRSDGNYIRDYIYIKDVVSAYVKLAENINNPNVMGQAFNISTDEKYTVLDIVNTILKVMGSDLRPKILNNISNEIREQYLSGEKIRKAIGWSPEYNLERGIAETVGWYGEIFGYAKK